MAQLMQLRRGTTAQHAGFTGSEGEVTVDTTRDSLVVHDGATAGGFPIAKLSEVGTGDFKADGSVPMTGSLTLSGAGTGIVFEGTTADANETTLVAGEPTADRTVTMPDATTTLAGLAVTQTFTAPQRGTRTTDNDCSFDLSVTNLWKCTPTAGAALTFTNHADGQSGSILFINGSNYAITAAATTKVTSSFLATISATGTYIINYTDDGTNTYCSTAGAMA